MPDAVGLVSWLAFACLSCSFFIQFLLVYLVACLHLAFASARCIVSLQLSCPSPVLLVLPLPFCWARLCCCQPLLVLSASGLGVAGQTIPPMVVYLGEAEKLTPQPGPCILRALLYRVLPLLGSGVSLGNLRGSVGMWVSIP